MQNETPPSKPALPLWVPFLLALSVWVVALTGWGNGSVPPLQPREIDNDPNLTLLRTFQVIAYDSPQRIQALWDIGEVRDPRVTVALVEIVLEPDVAKRKRSRPSIEIAACLLCKYHIPEKELLDGAKYTALVGLWWNEYGERVRQQAARLPQ